MSVYGYLASQLNISEREAEDMALKLLAFYVEVKKSNSPTSISIALDLIVGKHG